MPSAKAQGERQLRAELKRVQARLAESEATMKAIRSGDVDAIVIEGPKGSRIFTLQSPEEPYRILAERMNEGAATLTAEGIILFCNQRLAEMAGLPVERLLGTSFLLVLREGERETFPELLRQATNKDMRAEGHLRRADGATLPVQLSLNSIPLEKSEQGVCLIVTDLSGQKRAEAAKASIVDCSDDGIIGKTLDGTVTSWNAGAEKIYGYSAQEMMGQPISRVIPPDRLSEFNTLMKRIKQRQPLRHYETVRRRKDGQLVQVSLTISPIKDAAGKVVGASTIARDITEGKRAEQALRASELRTRLLLDSTAEAIYGEDLDGNCTFCNNAAARLLGYHRSADLLGKNMHAVMHHSQPDGVPISLENCQLTKAMRAGRDYHSDDLVLWRSDGTCFPAECWSHPLLDEGRPNGAVVTFLDISERKQAAEKLRIASLYTRNLIEASLDPLVTISREGKIIDVNQATETATGVWREHLIGSDFCDYFTQPEKARQGYEQVFAEGMVTDYPLAIRNASGSVTDVLYNASVFKNEAGEVEGVFAAARDITRRKQAEDELRLSRERLALAQKAGHSGTFDWDIKNNINHWSTEIEEVYGIAPGKFGGTYEDWEVLVVPEDLTTAKNAIQDALKSGEFASEWRIRRRNDGEVRWITARAKVIYDAAGQPARMLGLNMDITERKRAEEKVREASLYTRSLIEASLDPLVTISRVGKITDVNEATERVTGVSRQQLIGSDFSDYFTDPESARRGYEQVFAQGAVQDYPLAIRSTAGKITDVLYNATVFKNAAGEVEGIFAAARDITDRKRVEEKIRRLNQELEERVKQRTAQLRESEQRVRRKLESILSPEGDLGHLELADLLDMPAVQSLVSDFYRLAQIPMFILDLKGSVLASVGWQEVCTKFHRPHPEACKNCKESDQELSTGVAPGEFKLYKCKNNLWDVVTPITVGGQQVGNLFSGQFFFNDEPIDDSLFRAQARKYGFDEREYMAALERVPRLSREAVNTGMAFYIKLAQLLSQLSYSGIKLARSMTELNRLNTELAVSVKELEAFTYSVSHDLRAPLRHISGFSKMLAEDFGPALPPEARHHVQRIQEGTRRMGLLVDDLLNLARVGRRDLSLRVSGLKSVVDEVLVDLAPECAGRQIEWKIGDLPFVECDPGLMKQVFQNLLSNAVKFTRPRSPAVIEVGQKDQDGNPVVFVRDNGVGFSMKYADKLFGVFQRLHRAEDFEGTGVGLATVQRIIQKHGGRIWAEAELDKGATFYFIVATSEETELKGNAAKAGAGPHPGGLNRPTAVRRVATTRETTT